MRWLLWLFFLLAVAAGATWLGNAPGVASVSFQGYYIESPVAVFFGLVFLATLALWMMYQTIAWFIFLPARLRRGKILHDTTHGLEEATGMLAALMRRDAVSAERHMKKLAVHLKDKPITPLLGAHLALMQNDTGRTLHYYKTLLRHPQTEFLAHRYLSEHYRREGNKPQAAQHAAQALALEPGDAASLRHYMDDRLEHRQWQEALLAIDKAERKNRALKKQAPRYRALVWYEEGRKLVEAGESERALPLFYKAYRTVPGFPPYAAVLAQTLQSLDRQPDALRILRRAWKLNPHPMLSDLYLALIEPAAPLKRVKLGQQLFKYAPEHAYSHLMMARLALSVEDYLLAREHLKAALTMEESARACELMAELEEKETHSAQEAARWVVRAGKAPPEKQWLCQQCRHATEIWSLHCPSCHSLDSMEWQLPVLAYVEPYPLAV